VRLLLDECCAPNLAQALREAGHDVRHVLEENPGADDKAIADLAALDGPVLVTEDKDFGEIAIAYGRPMPGVILLRIEPRHRHLKAGRLLALLEHHAERVHGSFAVVEVAAVRLRPLPTTD
jgi:predicted nuclease of predicted toxin-antitoxin system